MTLKIISKEFLAQNCSQFIALIAGWKYATWKKENFLYELPEKWEFSFAVYENETLSGFCFASGKIPGVYYIHLLFVSEHLRGQRAGAKMLSYAQQIALKHDIHSIELRCPGSNTKAVDFYLNNHFKIISKLKDQISGDEADFYLQLKF
jgi:ribosomal protein S18 acetylase RimI-like enzyme